jgi:hypothetical protein
MAIAVQKKSQERRRIANPSSGAPAAGRLLTSDQGQIQAYGRAILSQMAILRRHGPAGLEN